jgi:hypothetical protein
VTVPPRAVAGGGRRQDLVGPRPTSLTAAAGSGVVELDWDGVGGAAEYTVYRSVVTGGGYELIGSTAGTSFSDSGVDNGIRYYYVVRALDAAGNEGAASNEAAATPSFPIGYAVLQFPRRSRSRAARPRRRSTARSTSGPHRLGRADLGDQGPGGLRRRRLRSAGWTTWRSMAFNTQSGNNYEYMGTLRPAAAGVYDLLVRFSTDGGLTWAYGDQDGFYPGEPGTDMPGVLTVLASGDTTPPGAPTDLHVTDWAASFIELAWTGPGDPDVAEYNVYRSEEGEAFVLLATVPVSPVPPAYRDEDVSSGTTYTYRVTAIDPSLNESGPSNEVIPGRRAQARRRDVPHPCPADARRRHRVHPRQHRPAGPWNPASSRWRTRATAPGR